MLAIKLDNDVPASIDPGGPARACLTNLQITYGTQFLSNAIELFFRRMTIVQCIISHRSMIT